MGFFSNYSTIGKIYKTLNLLENDLTIMQRELCFRAPSVDFVQASTDGMSHLRDLINLANNGGSTVQCANFEFAGQKRRIFDIIYSITEYMKSMMSEYDDFC